MYNHLKLATLLVVGLTAPAFAQEMDPAKLTCAEFAAMDFDARGVAAVAVIHVSAMVGALAQIEGYSPVQLITMGCQEDGSTTALAAAERQLSK